MAELRRLLISPKRLVMLLMIAVINLALFSGRCRTERERFDYNRQQRIDWGYEDDYEQKQLETYLTETYPRYLETVQMQSQSQSVLSKLSRDKSQNKFIDRNLTKTAEDYRRLGTVQLEYGENRGIKILLDYRLTDFLLLIAPLLLALELSGEGASAVGALTRSTKRGRVTLTAWRIFAVVLLNAANVLLLYGGNIAFTWYYFGNPGLSRAVQSIPEFQYCPYRLTFGSFFLSASLLKIAALTAAALFFWLLLARLHPVLSWGISALAFGGMYLLSELILPTAKLNHLKFINLFTALEANTFFTEYLNLNWFSYPSGFLTDLLIALTLLLVILTVLVLWLVGWCKPARLGERAERLREIAGKFLSRFQPVHTRFGAEGWKLLIAQRALLTAAAAGLLGWYLWKDISMYRPVSLQMNRIYTQYEGEITAEKIKDADEYLALLEERIETVSTQLEQAVLEEKSPQLIAQLQQSLSEYQEMHELYQKVDKILHNNADYTARTGRDAWFVRDEAYQLTFFESAAERRCCMVLLLFLIFAFSGMAAYDNRYDTRMLLRSTKHGRTGLYLRQLGWIALLSAAGSVGLHLITLLHIRKDSGFSMLHAPAQSLSYLQWIPVSISLRSALIWLMILRFLAAFALSAGIFCISRASRTPQKALLLSMLVFLLPSALNESGVLRLGALDFVHLLSCCKRL
ncbi:MAG: hypothetical protein IJ060_05440 [Oscillospiraceae bacterium]|nr:hypothetical protein [Oscillospiraceae bacterium]